MLECLPSHTSCPHSPTSMNAHHELDSIMQMVVCILRCSDTHLELANLVWPTKRIKIVFVGPKRVLSAGSSLVDVNNPPPLLQTCPQTHVGEAERNNNLLIMDNPSDLVDRRAFLYTLYTETPGRAFLEGRGGSKTSGCVFGFWSDIPLHNSEKHKERGSVQSVCSPESQAQTDLILALVKVAQPQFFRAKCSFTTVFCSLRISCFVATATWVAQLHR